LWIFLEIKSIFIINQISFLSETTAESSVSGSKAGTKKKQDENSQQNRKALAYKYMGCYQEVYHTNNGVRHQVSLNQKAFDLLVDTFLRES
jgi:hypothetical protein